jgi:site-specific recombinase XerD
MSLSTRSASTNPLLESFTIWAIRERSPRSKQLSEYTAKRYRRYVEIFSSVHGDPLKASKKEFSKWQSSLAGESPQTQNVKLSALRTFFEFLTERGLRKDNPTKGLSMQRVDNRQPRFLSRGIIDKLFTKVYEQPDLQDRAILEVLYGSGVRREEAGSLLLSNIVERDKLRVVGKGNFTRLTIITEPEFRAVRDHCIARIGDERTAELVESISPDAAFDELRKRMPDVAIFHNSEGTPLPDTGDPGYHIWKRVGHYAKAVEEKITPHQFRHSFATHLLSEGIDIYKVSKMLGHRDIKTTTIYLGLEDKVFDEVKQAHPRTHAVPAWTKNSLTAV